MTVTHWERHTHREKNPLRDTHIERHTQRYTETGRLETHTHWGRHPHPGRDTHSWERDIHTHTEAEKLKQGEWDTHSHTERDIQTQRERHTMRERKKYMETHTHTDMQTEKGMTEDEMAGWHHWLNGCESGRTLGVGDGQGDLACCDSWGRKESDTTERLNWTDWEEGKLTLIQLIPFLFK